MFIGIAWSIFNFTSAEISGSPNSGMQGIKIDGDCQYKGSECTI